MRDEHRQAARGRVSEDDLAQFPDPDAHELLIRWDMVDTPARRTGHELLDAQRDAHASPRGGPVRARPGSGSAAHPDQRVHPGRRRTSPLPRHPGQRGRDGGAQPARRLGLDAGVAAVAVHRDQRLACRRGSDWSTWSSSSAWDSIQFLPDRWRRRALPALRASTVTRVLDGRAAQPLSCLATDAAACSTRTTDRSVPPRPRWLPSDCSATPTRTLQGSARLLGVARGGNDSGRMIPLRAHQFVRTMRGMWACCNPNATAFPRTARWPSRRQALRGSHARV